MKHLFAYGTLMCADIMADVSGQDVSPVPAVLRGYRRLCVKGEHYPGLIAQAGYHVEGIIYRDISQSSWQRLDRFEGSMYTREQEQVEIVAGDAAGDIVLASVYVIHADYTGCLEDAEWDFEAFLKHGKKHFCHSYVGYGEV